MIELNLLPDIKRDFVRAQFMRRKVTSIMILISTGAVAVVSLLAIFVYVIQTFQSSALDGEIERKSASLTSIPDINNYLTIQNQLASVSQLHADKPIYSRLLTILPVINPAEPNNISISKLDLDDELSSMTIEGFGRDYRAVNVFNNTLKSAESSYTLDDEPITEPLFTDVQLSDVGLGEDADGKRVTVFKVTVSFSEDVFNRAASSVRIAVPNKDATTSAQNVPADIFREQAPEENQ